ncbi:phosphate signaling complex protein PhoU [Halalkalibacterium ligniniphilum]|uniref:phosphate signaling complex protein PhoU n=1 Tax=Halalkalibacterium ligniniphilum TaxID=1134413 RepID=UPI00034B9B5D|nr:phosphate signaling complex protein PhoU [Halalkalibacterium ligniniphilum]
MLRTSFHQKIDEIKEKIIFMGKETERQLNKAIEAISNPDAELKESIIREDKEINKLELDINNEVFLLIAKQQPVASDLRKLIVALKISSDLERVGDLAVDMAKVSRRLDVTVFKEKREALLEIAEQAKFMLNEALEAYKTSNILSAQKLATLDDKVDTLFSEFIKGLFREGVSKHDAEQVTQLAFIARYIERIADYGTNLGEWVVYEVNGKHFDLN